MKDKDEKRYMTGYLIKKYRLKKRLALKAATKPEAEIKRKHASLMGKINEIFGTSTTLTNAVLVNIENQDPQRHREPTATELYQIARALDVPMMALIVDADDPFGTCPLAAASAPDILDNSDVLRDELLIWGENDTKGMIGRYAVTLIGDYGSDPLQNTKDALTMNDIAHTLLNRISNYRKHNAQEDGLRDHQTIKRFRQSDIDEADWAMELMDALTSRNVVIPENQIHLVEQAAIEVADYWNADAEVWTRGGMEYLNGADDYATVIKNARQVLADEEQHE